MFKNRWRNVLMSKKIVVLTGSPRKNGNSFAMTDAFIKACVEKGHEVTRFDTAFMQVKSCIACGSCYSDGNPCVFNDGFNGIANCIEEADAVVFTCPVYWFGMPASLKAVLDKFYAFSVGNKRTTLAGKKAALLTCWEESGYDVADGVKFTYVRSLEFMKWTSVGEVGIPGVDKPGDIHQTDGIKQAIKLADCI
jgi:multimeric flavodoxin WrbA